jgi:hypothetical protein
LTQVASVGQGFIGRNSSVKVRFSEETAFGRSVLFLPQAEFRIFFGIWEHPVVDQIGMAVYRAKARKK